MTKEKIHLKLTILKKKEQRRLRRKIRRCSENKTRIICGRSRNFSAVNFPTFSPLVLLVKVW
jgi:hypothetical protein